MSEKLCVFCKHLDWDNGGGNEDYPDPASLTCNKGHKFTEPDAFMTINDGSTTYMFDLDDFRRVIVLAQSCPDYDQVKP